MKKILKWIGVGALAATLIAGCDDQSKPTLHVMSGSENEGLVPLMQTYADTNGFNLEVSYAGSVDISRCLEKGANCEADAVWPANRLWITLGDTQNVVKYDKSIMRSPVVLGLRCSVAESLGWKNSATVTMADILAASESGKFTLAMTSATQSNSGASFLFGALSALANTGKVLSLDDLGRPDVQDQLKRLLATVDRGAGSSGWLRSLIVENPDRFDAMVNYEAMVIETNSGWTSGGKHVTGLVEQGHEPLCVVYPKDGMVVADSPLGYIAHGNAVLEKDFQGLQAYLLSDEVQSQIEKLGRRTGIIGTSVSNADATVFNPAWGIDTTRLITPVPIPSADVIKAALNLYQVGLRKPSLTVWVLDVSGSMDGAGIAGLRSAMFNLLDTTQAEANLLQIGDRDVNIVITFSSDVVDVWKVEGNDVGQVRTLLDHTQRISAGGGTDIYRALERAQVEIMSYADNGTLSQYLPAVVAMTDGASDTNHQAEFLAEWKNSPLAKLVPIHSIAFGSADETQLHQLSDATIGRVFEAKDDLVLALRTARGYN